MRMKKPTLIGISILSVFILCSLSYQPIIADTPIDMIEQVKTSKTTSMDNTIIKELKNRISEIKSQVNDDCDCSSNTDWGFPIICSVLGVFLLIFMILVISMNQNQFLGLLEFVMSISNSLNCW